MTQQTLGQYDLVSLLHSLTTTVKGAVALTSDQPLTGSR